MDTDDPPNREWGILHPSGKITVRIDGHAFYSRRSAQEEMDECGEDCEWCPGGPHELVYRDRQPWRVLDWTTKG